MGFDGGKWPLSVSFELPELHSGDSIPLGGTGIKIGRGRTMACHLTCHVLLQTNEVPEAQAIVEMFKPALVSLCTMGCNWKRAASWPEMNEQVLGDKFKETKRQRPTVMQQYTLLSRGMLKESQESQEPTALSLLRIEAWDQAAGKFNASQGDSDCMISANELECMKVLDEGGPAFREKVAAHYNVYNAELSALPRKVMAMKQLRLSAEPPVLKKDKPVFFEAYTNSPSKMMLWLDRSLGAFQARIQQRERATGKNECEPPEYLNLPRC